jgi:hypothetical protein
MIPHTVKNGNICLIYKQMLPNFHHALKQVRGIGTGVPQKEKAA